MNERPHTTLKSTFDKVEDFFMHHIKLGVDVRDEGHGELSAKWIELATALIVEQCDGDVDEAERIIVEEIEILKTVYYKDQPEHAHRGNALSTFLFG